MKTFWGTETQWFIHLLNSVRCLLRYWDRMKSETKTLPAWTLPSRTKTDNKVSRKVRLLHIVKSVVMKIKKIDVLM